jgi:hypothetical protein
MKEDAEILTRYLVGDAPSEAITNLYISAISKLHILPSSPRDEKLLAFALAHPSYISFIDAAHALFYPRSVLRKKLYILFAILETQPQYAHLFLPEKRARGGFFYAGLVAERALLKALIGRVILFFI